MRTIDLLDDGVRIGYSGIDHALTLVREAFVPYVLVESVEVGASDVPGPWTLWRIGLAEPITDRRRGRFWRDGKRWLLDLRDPDRAVVIRLRPGGQYDAVAIQSHDPERLADDIRGRLS